MGGVGRFDARKGGQLWPQVVAVKTLRKQTDIIIIAATCMWYTDCRVNSHSKACGKGLQNVKACRVLSGRPNSVLFELLNAKIASLSVIHRALGS